MSTPSAPIAIEGAALIRSRRATSWEPRRATSWESRSALRSLGGREGDEEEDCGGRNGRTRSASASVATLMKPSLSFGGLFSGESQSLPQIAYKRPTRVSFSNLITVGDEVVTIEGSHSLCAEGRRAKASSSSPAPHALLPADQARVEEFERQAERSPRYRETNPVRGDGPAIDLMQMLPSVAESSPRSARSARSSSSSSSVGRMSGTRLSIASAAVLVADCATVPSPAKMRHAANIDPAGEITVASPRRASVQSLRRRASRMAGRDGLLVRRHADLTIAPAFGWRHEVLTPPHREPGSERTQQPPEAIPFSRLYDLENTDGVGEFYGFCEECFRVQGEGGWEAPRAADVKSSSSSSSSSSSGGGGGGGGAIDGNAKTKARVDRVTVANDTPSTSSESATDPDPDKRARQRVVTQRTIIWWIAVKVR